MKYRIVIDSNIIYRDKGDLKFLFPKKLNDLSEFIEKNNISDNVGVFIPRVVFEERLNQNLKDIEEIINKYDTKLLSGFKFNKFIIKNNIVEYEKIIRKENEKYLKKINVTIIDLPKVSQDKVLERAYKNKRPFKFADDKISGKDRGYKDTMIWLSILNDAEINFNKNYIFVTNDVDFINNENTLYNDLEKEFSEINNKKFYCFKEIEDVKKFLDVEFKLKLSLKEREEKLHDDIKNEIKKNIGTIMVFFNSKSNFPRSSKVFESMYDSHVSILPTFGHLLAIDNKNSERFVGFDFSNIEINNINQIINDEYLINATLTVIGKKDSNPYMSNIFMSTYSDEDTPFLKHININYNHNNKKVIDLTLI